jgi:hypothetical protein
MVIVLHLLCHTKLADRKLKKINPHGPSARISGANMAKHKQFG